MVLDIKNNLLLAKLSTQRERQVQMILDEFQTCLCNCESIQELIAVPINF